jgi:CO/xanthine dehydrogenase FAD-binding subunit
VIRYAKPTTVNEALALLGEGPWRLLAGGTDFYPALGSRPLRENVLDLNGLDELRGVSETATHFVIGARTTWSDIVVHKLPPAFDALKEAGREVGSIQIQNTGTVAGNLCNASPAADGVPALMILDADVEVQSRIATRHLPSNEFILGNRRTALQPGEMVTAVRVPKISATGSSSFFKLGARRYLVISIAMAAARIAVRDGVVEDAAVSVGACSAVAQRLETLEAALRGRPADSVFGRVVDEGHLAGLKPIEDVRGSAEYRRLAAREIVTRAVDAALSKALKTGRPATVAA